MNLTIRKAFIIGDSHGNSTYLENSIVAAQKYGADALIQVGDFGHWPGHNCDVTRDFGFPIYFVEGNHEDHGHLQSLPSKINILAPNLTHLGKGAIITIQEKNILCIGGAYSIDKDNRTPGLDWFPEEEMTHDEYKEIMNLDIRIHGVLSHDAPIALNVANTFVYQQATKNRNRLQNITDHFRPDFWFFGHYHMLYEKYCRKTDTAYIGLPADVNNPRLGCLFDFKTEDIALHFID